MNRAAMTCKWMGAATVPKDNTLAASLQSHPLSGSKIPLECVCKLVAFARAIKTHPETPHD
eukprot:1990302-Amphidinium_carterae.1